MNKSLTWLTWGRVQFPLFAALPPVRSEIICRVLSILASTTVFPAPLYIRVRGHLSIRHLTIRNLTIRHLSIGTIIHRDSYQMQASISSRWIIVSMDRCPLTCTYVTSQTKQRHIYYLPRCTSTYVIPTTTTNGVAIMGIFSGSDVYSPIPVTNTSAIDWQQFLTTTFKLLLLAERQAWFG